MTLQYRTRGVGKASTHWEWVDVTGPISSISFSDAGPESFYWSSTVNTDQGNFDIEVREKPEFEPGFYQNVYNPLDILFWHDKPQDPEDWKRVRVVDYDS